MVMLSDLLRWEITDARGTREQLTDLALSVLEVDYPLVSGLLFRSKNDLKILDWTGVKNFDSSKRAIGVEDLSAAKDFPEDANDVLLRRDVLDALIIDLEHRRTTRANDLRLVEEDGELRLRSVDAGIGAMLRRISRGWYRSVNRDALFDWKYVEFLRGDPSAVDNGAGYRLRINRLPAGEIAQIADYVPYLHAAELLTLLPDDKAADVLEAMSVERQHQVIDEFDESEAVALLEKMSPDLAADLVGRLDAARMKRYLGLMSKKKSERIIELLRYAEDSVGGVMINDIICLESGTCVEKALEVIRMRSKEVDFTSLIFVVENNNDRKLLGTVALRDLLNADNDIAIEKLMDAFVATLNPNDSAKEAAYRLIGGQLAAMPVTEPDGKLIGAVTIDAAVSQIVSATSSLQTLRVFS